MSEPAAPPEDTSPEDSPSENTSPEDTPSRDTPSEGSASEDTPPEAVPPAVVTPGAAVLDRLALEKNVWLCTVRPDGSPHVTPVWFVFLRGGWWIGADGGSVKVRNIENYSRVSLALEDGRSPVVAEGDAVVHRGPFPADIVDAFATKYGWDVSASSRPGDSRVLLEVPVRRWLLAGTAQ